MIGKRGQAITFGNAPRLILLFVLIGMILAAGIIALTSFRDSSRSTKTDDYATITAANSTAVSYKTSSTGKTVYSCGTPTSITNGTPAMTITSYFTIVSGTTCTATLTNNSFNGASVKVNYVSTLEEPATDVLDEAVDGGGNISDQLPTVGTIMGVALILVVVIGVFAFFAMRGGAGGV